MIDKPYLWTNILGLAIGTFAIRYSIIALSSRFTISDRTKEIFTYIPAAILPAFIIPSTFLHRGNVEWMLGKERFIITIAACVLCFLVRSTVAVIVFGLAALYLVTHTL